MADLEFGSIKPSEDRVAVIRTSDRQTFKRCRRKWAFQSHLRMNLDQIERPSYFWIGTGGHFALEDWHGYNYYGHPCEAFLAYRKACIAAAKVGKIQTPDDMDEQTELCIGILENYLEWCTNRDALETLWIDGEPQVEVKIRVPLPIEPPEGYDLVVYQGTIDRVCVIDKDYWIQDWKFYKSFQDGLLDFDQQMSAYSWIASTVYEEPIAGAMLHQFRKTLPVAPRILVSGKISTASDQLTTHGLYKHALIELYGTVDKSPRGNVRCLNELAAQEGFERDRFIARERTHRTPSQLESEGTHILMEAADMLDPDLPLYPNATKDCSWDCQNLDVCLMMNRDDHWQSLLQETTVSRIKESDEWRNHLKGKSQQANRKVKAKTKSRSKAKGKSQTSRVSKARQKQQ